MNNSISRPSKEAASKEKASKEAASKEKALKEAALKERESLEGRSFERESLQEGSLMQEFASGGGVGGMGICLLLFTPPFRCYYSLPGPPKGTPLPRSFLLLFGRFCKGKFEGAGRAGFLKIGGSRPTPPVACRNRVAGIDLFLCSRFRRKMETCT